MPSDLGIFGYIYAYVFKSFLLFVFSSIYLTNLAKMNYIFFSENIFDFFAKNYFSNNDFDFEKLYFLTNDSYFLNLSVHGLFDICNR